MKYFLPIFGASSGVAISLFFTQKELLATTLIVSLFGAIVGFAVGTGVVALFIRKRMCPVLSSNIESKTLHVEMSDTYWRNKGHISPSTSHSDPEGARGDWDP